MMRNKHNLYVSTPDWFTSQPKVEETIKTATVTAQPVIMSGGGSGGIGSVKLHNKAISKEKELSINDLTVDGYAVLIVELQPNPVNPEAVLPKPGEYIPSSQWSSSKYIEVVEGSTLAFNTSYDTLSQYGIAFYDLTHRFISGVAATGEEQIITVPTKSRYFRVCGIKTYEPFKVTYVEPGSYTVDELNDIYENGIDPFTNLKYDYEVLHTFNADIDELSLIVDAPLKLELDSKNNIHLNLNDLSATGLFVTTTEEQQLVAGIKTFDNGIGIGEYLIVPDNTNHALRVVHRNEIFPLEDDPETEENESLPKKFGNLYTSGWLSALGISSEEVGVGGTKQALYELDDVLPNITATGVLGAEEGSVLTFNGSHWYATKIEHPKGMLETDVLDILKRHLYVTETFLKEKEYLTRPDADKRYLLIDMFRKVFTLLDPNGVEITDFTNVGGEISEVRVNYSLWSTGFISALGKQSELTSNGTALYQLDDVLSSGSLVQGALKGSVLMFDGSHWYADIIETPEVITLADVLSHLDTLKYLREEKAHELFLTPEEGHELFLTQEEGDGRYLLRSQFEKIFTSYSGNTKTNSSDPNSIIDNVKVNFGFWSEEFISALGKQIGSNATSTALYQLDDVLADGDEVEGARKGYVLTYNGSHWYAAKTQQDPGLLESDVLNIVKTHLYKTLTELKDTFYTETEIDDKFDLYYTKDESDELFLTRNLFKKIFTAYNSSGSTVDITSSSASINNISVNYGFWSKSFLSAKGKLVDTAIDYMDYIHVDEETISKKNGYLEFIGDFGNSGIEQVSIKVNGKTYNGVGTTQTLITLPDYPELDLPSYLGTTGLTNSFTIKNSSGATLVTYNGSSALSLTLAKSMVGLGSVENTALSTWAGSNKITTVGTISSGTWNGSRIGLTYMPTGTNNYVLIGKGTSSSPVYIALSNLSVGYATEAGDADYASSAGSATNATYAINDGDGNKISSTYLKLSGGKMTGDLEVNNSTLSTTGILQLYGTGSYGTKSAIHFGDSGSEVNITNTGDTDLTIHANGTIYLTGSTNITDDLLVDGGITMYSDIRKKTKLQDVELSLDRIANAPLILHYYNNDKNKITHVSSIAQYWVEFDDWFCKTDSEGYYTMEIQNLALASAISVAKELYKFESETDRRIRQLEEELETLKRNKYGSFLG